MVSRSELLAAQSQAKANKDDADSKAKDLAFLQEQLKKAIGIFEKGYGASHPTTVGAVRALLQWSLEAGRCAAARRG